MEEQLAKLTADFEKATCEKLLCQQEADATNATIQLANRLVGGLASENVRWAEAVDKYNETFINSEHVIDTGVSFSASLDKELCYPVTFSL